MNKKRPVVLVILDGFGYKKMLRGNAIMAAKMPFFNHAWNVYAHSLLQASGYFVGLPAGYTGNSEVGHTTIGAGAICQQPMSIINDVIARDLLHTNETFRILCETVIKNNTRLHIMGILSNGGVHGHEEHIYAYIKAAYAAGVRSIIVHAFLDGRDAPQESAGLYLAHLDDVMSMYPGVVLGSVHGRFYAMDRDHNFDRTKKTFDVLVQKTPVHFDTWQALLSSAYQKNITDEFVEPESLREDSYIQRLDGVLCANIRPDRARQLVAALCEFQKKGTMFFLASAVPYEQNLCAQALFYPIHPRITLKEVLNDYHKRIYTIAETEKYAHVTYFFDGGKEMRFAHETRVLIPSLKRERYDQDPEMSAKKITQNIKSSLYTDPHDFYLVNYANADMVGHSGNFGATVEAVECLDQQLQILYQEVVQKRDGILCITSDHGKAEEMVDCNTGFSKTAHTTNPVPFLMICNKEQCGPKKLPLSQLADIAPFLLDCMHLPVPSSMQVNDRGWSYCSQYDKKR